MTEVTIDSQEETSENVITTESILASMLIENTGRSFLDSGEAYGRNWQRNQFRNFEEEKSTNLKFEVSSYNDKIEISVVHNLYHWLKDRCHYEPELDAIFQTFSKETDPDNDKTWMQLMSEFPGWLENYTDEDGNVVYGISTGFYGEGEPVSVNTYNEEELLSQVIQFIYFGNEQGEFISLQIHGGADVRGGYTMPRIFSVGHMGELDIFEYNRASIYCTQENHLPEVLAIKEMQEKQIVFPNVKLDTIGFDEQHSWFTDDGHNWYDNYGETRVKNLEDYEVIDMDSYEDSDEEMPQWKPGLLFIKDGVGYCPHCGAKLEASF